MNYITQLNKLHELQQTTPLSKNGLVLYFALLQINNSLGWIKEFKLSNKVLMEYTKLSKMELYRARLEVTKLKLICYQTGAKNETAPTYEIIEFEACPKTKVEPKPNQSETKLETLNKLNKTKLNIKKDKTKVLSKKEPEKEEKLHFAEFVKMTNAEYSTLSNKYSKEFADQCIDLLNNYKGSSGKIYKSDYRAILTWVVNEVTKRNNQNMPYQNQKKKVENQRQERNFDGVEDLME